ncbi:MAG: translation initiation factor IF-3 [Actinomycetota bacterium]
MDERKESLEEQESRIAVELRVNDRIRTDKVRVVGADGSQVGILDTEAALRMAEEADLDLVEVAPQADPPVCRIMDYGKYKYELAVKQKEARKKQSQIVVKEMKMRPKIDRHDYETKKGHVVRFLRQGAKVKITIMFRGREMSHLELGRRLLDRLAEDVTDVAKVEVPAKVDGRNMTMVLNPLKEAVVQKPQAPSRVRPARPQPEPAAEVEETAEEAEPEVPEEVVEEKPARPSKVTRAEGG